MKHLTILLLTLSFLAVHLQPVAVQIWFVANQATIVSTRCEQRAKPKNCCVGKCQLRKAIKQQKQHSSQAQVRYLELITTLYGYNVNVTLLARHSNALLPGVYTLQKGQSQPDKIFQPPKGNVVTETIV